jgi:glycosyltransferase involved in cell wall biosynthesis
LVGDGETRTDLEQKARTMGIESAVRFVGRVTFQSVPRWIAACDVCVVLHKPMRSYPGDSMKLWEYLACARAVVTNTGPGYGDLVDSIGCGLAVPSDRAEELAKQLVYLLQHEETRQDMGKQGRAAVVKAHTWGARALELEQVCRINSSRARNCFTV